MMTKHTTKKAIALDIVSRNPGTTVEQIMYLMAMDPSNSKVRSNMVVTMSSCQSDGLAYSRRIKGRTLAYFIGPDPEPKPVAAPAAEPDMPTAVIDKPDSPQPEPATPLPTDHQEPLCFDAAPTTGPVVNLSSAVDQIAQAVAGAIEAALNTRLADIIQKQLQQAMDALPAQILQTALPTPKPANQEHKYKLVIVGLIGSQTSIIRGEFGDVFHIEFFEAHEKNGGRLRSACNNSHAAITMTNFINHSVHDIVQGSNVKHIRVDGGMSSLRDAITKFYLDICKDKAAA